MRSRISSVRAWTVIAFDVSPGFGRRSIVRTSTPRRASSSVSIVPAAPAPTTKTGTWLFFISPSPIEYSARAAIDWTHGARKMRP